MFGRKLAYEVVPEVDYTDFSDRENNSSMFNAALIGVGTAATASITTYAIVKDRIVKSVAETLPPLPTEPVNVLTHAPDGMMPAGEMIPISGINPEMAMPTGVIAEKSLAMLADVFDPFVQILVAISFPIASVIMVGACFFFMFGNSEKAWSMIMNAGLGYVLIQMSPLFLNILRQIGSAL